MRSSRLAASLPILVVAGGLCACSKPPVSEGEKFEAMIAMLQKNGGKADELCQLHKNAAQAFLRDGNQTQYTHHKIMVDMVCLNARLDEQIARTQEEIRQLRAQQK